MSFKILKICYLWQGKKQVPKIQVSGEWLRAAGFQIGENIKIEVSENKIIIRNEFSD